MTAEREKTLRLVGWGITEKCNLSCPHCYSSAAKYSPDELSTAECIRIIDYLAEFGAQIIGWTGGEPLLRKDLEIIISHAKNEHDIKSGITTNGVPLNKKRAESLKDAGVGVIQVSIDGSTAHKNHLIRNATDQEFHLAFDGIHNCKQVGMKVHLAMMLGKQNLDDAFDFVKLAARLGVESVRFCGFVPWGKGKTKTVKSRLDLLAKVDKLRSLVEELSGVDSPVIMFDPAFGPLPPEFCFHDCVSGIETIYISANGDVYPCTALLDQEFKVGNLRQREFVDLWNDPQMTRISSYPRDRITGHCRNCGYFPACRGGCRGIAHAYTGDLNASLPLCLSRVPEKTGASSASGAKR